MSDSKVHLGACSICFLSSFQDSALHIFFCITDSTSGSLQSFKNLVAAAMENPQIFLIDQVLPLTW